MPRLRIVELPMTHVGDVTETPFVVIFDQVSQNSPLNSTPVIAELLQMAKEWGARGAFFTADTIELADELPLAGPPEAAEGSGHDFAHPDYPAGCSLCGLSRSDWETYRQVRTCPVAQDGGR